MRAKLTSVLAVLGLFSTLTAAAVPSAVVEVVQAPAWLERGERRLPLAPGMVLENRDRLLTGQGARAIVKLADGSAVKFGEGANVAVNALKAQNSRDDNQLFTAALDLAKGAFRLTTGVFRQYTTQRAINVRTGVVTIGIRGTDLWGRSNEAQDLVCLIEGRISLHHPEGGAAELNEPLQFYTADKGQLPNPVGQVDPGQLAQWAQETELQPGGASLQAGGRWFLRFERMDKDGVLGLYDRLSDAGYPVRIRPVMVDGVYWYELNLSKLVSQFAAQSLADRLVRDLHVPTPAVRRQ